MYQPGYRSARRRLAHWRWFEHLRALLHVVAALALLGTLLVSSFAEAYFSRGVASGVTYEPLPFTNGNPMGVNTFLNEEPDPAVVERSLQMIAEGGFGYVRQIFGWYEIEPQPDTFIDANGVSTWEKYDRIVDLAVANGLQLIVRLEKPPRWARAGAANPEIDGPPDRLQDYVDFVEMVVARYAGRVTYFQIWNEPNLAGEWGGEAIDPRGYVDLLQAGYGAVKRANPDAVVLLAGLAPTEELGPDNLSDLLFLERVYEAGGADYFDIATVMVYGYGYSPFDRRVSFARNNFSRPIQTREIMVRHGDAGTPIWAVEYGWVSLPEGWTGRPSPWGASVSPDTQARYLVEGFARAQQEWPWMGVMAVWAFRFVRPPDDPAERDNPTRGFAIVEHDFTPRPAYTALARVAPTLQRDFPGSYQLSAEQQTWLARGEPLDIFLYGERLDVLVFGDGALHVSVDGGAPATKRIATDAWRLLTVAEGLDNGPHVVRLRLGAVEGRQLPAIDGYVVSRNPLHTWVYPWVNAALFLALLLVLASALWTLVDLRGIRALRARPAFPARHAYPQPAMYHSRREGRT
ncbi:MAG: hypothetical protein DCC58_03445 [Chloroflexi bacterium]|nr:MAG: hypothetical protein DCC58_03445 [Chloroflexota bacterium]